MPSKKEIPSPAPMMPGGKIVPQPIVQEMETSYLDYAMSVIISRALPDVRDGLKPVHRRILYSMWTTGLRPGAKFRKSATVVGDVLGRFHPHGDVSVYDSLVRMAQEFSMRYQLVHGQGNFGSIDGDSAAAYRYCVTGDTRIVTDRGLLKIDELSHEEDINIRILSWNRTVNTASKWFDSGTHPTLRVTTSSGHSITGSFNHPILVRTKKNKARPAFVWKRLDEIGVGDIAVIDRSITLWPEDNKQTHFTPLDYSYGIKRNDSPVRIAPRTTTRMSHELFLETCEDQYLFEPILSIEKAGIQKVYSLRVDSECHSFVGNGFINHNTESKLMPLSEELLTDIEKETVDFMPNYDGVHQEPKVLPAATPNLLLNGTVGIAVGMATNIPPHNLSELSDALMTLIDNPDATVEDLMQSVKGPDFPTGGIIYNSNDIKQAYATGRGPIVMRAKTEIDEDKNGQGRIIVSEIPYQVNKATLLEHIADLVRDKKIEGIRDLRDESSKEGIRIVVELKKDAYPKKVLNRLFQATQLQETFHVNMLALVDGIQPRVLTLKAVLEEFLKHRGEVVRRRATFDLARARDRAHILDGLKIALLHIDKVIETIKKSKDRDDARINLVGKFKLSEAQANAILDMRLSQLASLERLKIETELKEKQALIAELESLLKSSKKILGVIRTETEELKKKYGDERRTQVVGTGIKEFSVEDVIPNEQTILMITRDGYIKRLPPDTFKTQRRGGKGVIGVTTKEEDVVDQMFGTTTHSDLLFFTTRGRVFQLKAYDIPPASRTAKGMALVNFLQLGPGEKVSAALPMADLTDYKYLVMVTKAGTIKKTDIKDFESVRRSGLIALRLHNEDTLEWVKPSTGNDEIALVSAKGQAIRFKEKDVRGMGRVAAGVRGMRLGKGDHVVSLDIVEPDMVKKGLLELLVVMDNGFGKRSNLKHYKVQHRGGKGIKTANVTTKTGEIVYAQISNAKDERDLIVISENGQVIRIPFGTISVLGRATQGVRIMRFKEEKDSVASVTFV